MRSGRVQMGAAICRRGFLNLAQSHGANEDTIAFEQCGSEAITSSASPRIYRTRGAASSPSNHANTALDSA